MQDHLGEFEARGVRVVAISVDPPEVTRNHCQKQGYTFTFLSDGNHEVIRRYDLLHVGGGPQGDIARPAEFLIDPSGVVRWVNLTENYRVRARPEQMLEVIDRLLGPSTAPRAQHVGPPRHVETARAALDAPLPVVAPLEAFRYSPTLVREWRSNPPRRGTKNGVEPRSEPVRGEQRMRRFGSGERES